MLQAPVLWLVIDDIIIGHTQAGQVGIHSVSVLIFNIPDKVTIAIAVAVDKEHNCQELIFGNLLGLFTLCSSRQVRISCNTSKDFLDSLRMRSNATA